MLMSGREKLLLCNKLISEVVKMNNKKQKPLNVCSPIKQGNPIDVLNKRTKAFPLKLVCHGNYPDKISIIRQMWEQQRDTNKATGER